MTDQDHRVQCIACANLRNGWCKNAIAAGFGKQPEHQIGKELAVLKQDCPGFKEKK
jgi:hypothetical protein